MYVTNCGDNSQVVDFANTGWQEWQTPTLENIVITEGTCTIGLKVVSNGGTWGYFDDASLLINQ